MRSRRSRAGWPVGEAVIGCTASACVRLAGRLVRARSAVRRTWTVVGCQILACLVLAGCTEPDPGSSAPTAASGPGDSRPNLLLIVADDLGFTDLGAFGGEIPTPNLDALALAGVRLTNFHASALCQETRAMLMSGMGSGAAIQYRPPRPDGERANLLRADVATLPELLRDAGYRTYMAGKWDLGLTEESTPLARGFDRSFALLEASASHFAEPFWSEVSYYREDERRLELVDLGDDFYSTRAYTDKLLEYLNGHDATQPWFGYLAYTSPHWPLQVPDAWLDRHAGAYDAGYDALRARRMEAARRAGVLPEGALEHPFQPTAPPWSGLDDTLKARYARAQEVYAAMVEYMDREVGRVVDYLRASGQLDRTLILFMSDHGASAAELGIADGPSGYPPHFDELIARRDNRLENIGRRGSFVDHGRGFAEAATAPFRFYKGVLAEGGTRAAAFVHYPSELDAGVSATFTTVMDLLPTFLEFAGGAHPGPGEYDGRVVAPIAGRSFWPLATGAAPSYFDDDRSAGWSLRGTGALVRGSFKALSPMTRGGGDEDGWQLFDLANDPTEGQDLSGQFPERVAAMRREWEQDWR